MPPKRYPMVNTLGSIIANEIIAATEPTPDLAELARRRTACLRWLRNRDILGIEFIAELIEPWQRYRSVRCQITAAIPRRRIWHRHNWVRMEHVDREASEARLATLIRDTLHRELRLVFQAVAVRVTFTDEGTYDLGTLTLRPDDEDIHRDVLLIIRRVIDTYHHWEVVTK